MPIKVIAPLGLLLAFFLAACETGASQQAGKPALAVIDVARVMRDSEPGKAGIKFLESRQAEMQAKLDAIQKRLEQNPQDQQAMQEIQQTYAVSQQRMQAEQQNVVNQLFDSIQRVLNEFRSKNGYEAILGAEAVVSYDPKVDVTEAVIAEVNSQLKMEFKPLPEAALAPPLMPSIPASMQAAPAPIPPAPASAPNADQGKAKEAPAKPAKK